MSAIIRPCDFSSNFICMTTEVQRKKSLEHKKQKFYNQYNQKNEDERTRLVSETCLKQNNLDRLYIII